ncbi:MAG: MotA/TolQ/ExbB proton channel family protein [Candidatus Krumholzibacteria bacterium]|nr:MotA/TolQ/ExbB proton channel family protein [Candidatus Krumholzibacteria bacterium]
MDTSQFLALFHDGWISNYPLAVGSIVALSIFFERIWRFRGLVEGARALTRETIQALIQRDIEQAKELCDASDQPIAKVFVEAMSWQNAPLEDLERVLSTSRQEVAYSLKRGLWVIGTVGSLAPYVGLFGTVVGIIRAFGDMAEHGAGGFEVVAAGISEALIATAAGLAVAIIALVFFNFLQTRVGAIAAAYSRSCERFVQALLFLETSSDEGEEEGAGGLVPA